MTPQQAIYIYGITSSQLNLTNIPFGLEGKKPFLIADRNLALLVSELAETEDFKKSLKKPELLSRLARTHEGVVHACFDQVGILPFRLGTLLKSYQDATQLINKQYLTFHNKWEQLKDKQEFGLKIIQDPYLADNSEEIHPPFEPDSNAKQYLWKIWKKNLGNQSQKHKQDIEAIHQLFVQKSDNYKIKKSFQDKMLLESVYLIEKYEADALYKVFYEVKRKHPHFKYLWSGPWPPYHFVELALKV